MSQIIIGVVADIAAGKGTLSKYIKEHHNAKTLRFSTPLRDILDRLHLKQSRKNLANLANTLRQTFGTDILAKTLKSDAKNSKESILLIEGIRNQGELDYVRSLPNSHIIYITADPKIRWQRVIQRNENPGDSEKTFEDFLKDEQHESDKHAQTLGAQANFIIKNEKDYESFYSAVAKIINTITHANKN